MGTVDPARWGRFNSAQATRSIRPLASAAAELAGPGEGRTAVELGCGIGREAVFLADQGWKVHTYDADPTVVDELTRLSADRPIHHTRVGLADLTDLPACDLLLACVSLPFVPREHFPAVWAACLASLRPEAVLAVDLFGCRDDWAADGEGTFLTRSEVDTLTSDLDVLVLDEQEYDGKSFSGGKHWHTFQLIGRGRG